MGGSKALSTICLPYLAFLLIITTAQGVKDCKDVSDGGEWVVSTGLLKDANMTFQEIIDCVPLGGTLRLQGNLSIPAPPTVLSQPIVLLSDVDGLKPELACESEGSMFNIRSNGIVFEGLRITNCSSEGSGSPAVVVDIPVERLSEEDVLFSNVDFVGNENKYGPGALLIKSADLVVFDNVAFIENKGLNGGALEVTSSSIEMIFNGCSLQRNQASRWGGALYYNPLKQVSEKTTLGNEEMSGIIVKNSTFDGNSAKGLAEDSASGGAIALGISHLSFLMTQSHMKNNSASGYGGALWLQPSSFGRDVHIAIHETVLIANQASYGGALALMYQKARCTMSSSVVADNKATGEVLMQDGIAKGGGLFLIHPESVLIKGTLFMNNIALPVKGRQRVGRRLLQQAKSVENVVTNQNQNQSTLNEHESEEQELPFGAAIHLHRADNPLEQYGWDQFAGPEADEMLKHTTGAAGGSIFLLGLGLQQTSRVLGAPVSSNCSKQCVSDPPDNLEIVDPMDGCGLMGDHRVCALQNHLTCRSFEDVQKLYIEPNGPWVAVCTVDAHGTSMEAADSQFVNNTSHNGGAIAVISGAALFLHDQTKFLNNSAEKYGGGIYAGSRTLVSAQNASFKQNRAKFDGGGITLKGQNSEIVLGSVEFYLNSATEGSGGAISSQGSNAMIDIKPQVEFRSNWADHNGGAVAIEGRATVGNLKSTLFDSNRARLGGGALYAKSTVGAVRITFRDVDFRYNSVASSQEDKLRQGGLGGAMLLEGMAVNVILMGTFNSFTKNEAREGGAIRIINAGGFDAGTAHFQLNKALTGGGIHLTYTEKTISRSFVLRNSTFEANSALMGGGLMADAKTARAAFVRDDALSSVVFGTYDEIHMSKLKIELYGLRMNSQSAIHSGGGMLLMDIEALCEYCEFSDNRVEEMYNGKGGAISLQDAAILSIETSVFTDNRASFGGAVHSKDSVFRARDARFSHNTAYQSGGAISAESRLRTYEQLQTVLELHSSVIESNGAAVGGGIQVKILPWYQNDLCTPLSHSSGLEPNTYERVISDIQDYCELNDKSMSYLALEVVRLMDVTLWKNEAEEAGGGLFLSSPEYVCACCRDQCTSACHQGVHADEIIMQTLVDVCPDLWTGNSVQQYGYGSTIATSAVRSDVQFDNGNEWSVKDELIEHNSGDPIKPFTVRLLDAFGQVTTNTPPSLFVRLSSDREILSGQVDKEVHRGIAKFESTIVTAHPALHILTIQLPIELNIGQDWVSVHIRNCTRGEQVYYDGFNRFQCLPCQNGTFSLHPGGHCKTCSSISKCNGQSMVPIDGYWQPSSYSLTLKRCLSDRACSYPGRVGTLQLQSIAFKELITYKDNYTLCHQGYTGVLCGSCEKGYARFGAFECRECLASRVSLWLGIGAGLWLVLVVIFTIRASLWPANTTSAGLPSRRESVEASGRTQSIFSLSREYFEIDCKVLVSAESAKTLLNFMQVSSLPLILNTKWAQVARMVFEIEDILSGFSTSSSGLFLLGCLGSIFNFFAYAQFLVMGLFLPLAIALLILIFSAITPLIKNKCCMNRSIASLLVVFYMFYLGCAKRAFSIFRLVQVDGISDSELGHTKFWADDTSYVYFQDTHIILIFIGLVFIGLWTLAYPLGLIIFLMLNAESLDEESFAERYGFLYQAYRKNCLYWEAVAMFRKAMLAAVSVFMFSLSGNLQCSIALLIMIVSLTTHLIVQPYKSQLAEIRNKETMSLCGSTFIYLVALVLTDESISDGVRFVLSMVSVSVCVGITSFFALSMILRGLSVLEAWKRPTGSVCVLNRMNCLRRLKESAQHRWHAQMDRLWMRVGEIFLQNLEDGESVSGFGNDSKRHSPSPPFSSQSPTQTSKRVQGGELILDHSSG